MAYPSGVCGNLSGVGLDVFVYRLCRRVDPAAHYGGHPLFDMGAILFVFMRWRGVPMPKLIHWRSAIIVEILLLGLGNGSVAWAETTLPTGLSALVVAIVPLWMVLMDWLRPGGVKPKATVFLGIALGLVGMLLLIGPSALGLGEPLNPVGLVILISATLCWALGSIFSRQAVIPDSPLILTGMEMLAGGVFLMFMAAPLGEYQRFDPAAVSSLSWWSLVYLIAIGSFLGFTAYVFLLQVSTPAKVSTYAYVNPVVAVFLGWALNGEQITLMTIVASAVILAGVAMIHYLNTRPGPKRESPLEMEPAAGLEVEPTPRIAMDEPSTARR